MKKSIQSFAYDPLDTTSNKDTIPQDFKTEKFKKCFPIINSDVCNRFKSSTILFCITCYEKVNESNTINLFERKLFFLFSVKNNIS